MAEDVMVAIEGGGAVLVPLSPITPHDRSYEAVASFFMEGDRFEAFVDNMNAILADLRSQGDA
jgi:hypothetical protein